MSEYYCKNCGYAYSELFSGHIIGDYQNAKLIKPNIVILRIDCEGGCRYTMEITLKVIKAELRG